MNTNPPRDFLLYLAGFWDGEGSFSISMNVQRRSYGEYPSFQRSVHVTNTNLEVLLYIKETLQAGSILEMNQYRSQQNPKWKPAYKLAFSAEEARVLAALLLPYLRIKQEQARIIAEWPHKARGGGGVRVRDTATHEVQRLLHERMKELNARGTPVLITEDIKEAMP
jgi:hypothetical protein